MKSLNLVDHFKSIVSGWESSFKRQKTHRRMVDVAIGLISSYGRKTITTSSCFRSTLEFVGADYKLFTRNPKKDDEGWDSGDLFKVTLLETVKELPPDDLVVVSMDDTCLPKTGKKIPQARYCHDPLAPKFLKGACRWGIRMLHCAVTLPIKVVNQEGYKRPMVITTTFRPVPGEPKPKNLAVMTAEEVAKHEARKRESNLTHAGVRAIQWHRAILDQNGHAERNLLFVVDGSYCNGPVIRHIPKHRTHLIGRFRETADLCVYIPKEKRKGKAFYGPKLPTPGQYLRGCYIPSSTGQFTYGGRARTVRYMVIENVAWKGAGDRPMRVIILRPTPYNRTGARSLVSFGRRRPKRGYNRPAFLITTDTESPVERLIQAYYDRWQIEVLHREMKSEVGVGQTQVRNELANERTHSLQAAAFAALNLAAYRVYGGQWHRSMPQRPSWRKRPPMRLSARELLNCFRNDLVRSGFFATKSKKTAKQEETWVLPDRETYAAA